MDLESKRPLQISVQFTDESSIEITGWNAEYIWLHLKNSTDLIPLLYRSKGTYSEKGLSIPIAALLEENYGEPITR